MRRHPHAHTGLVAKRVACGHSAVMMMLSVQDRQAVILRRRLSALCVAAGLLALMVGVAAETYRHLPPCPLCLWERWPYRALIAFGVIGTTLPRSFGRIAVGLAMMVLVFGLLLAVLHVGVEHHWWHSPLPACQGILVPGAPLPDTPAPPCDAPAYLFPPIKLSMALLGLLYQAAIIATLIGFFPRTKRIQAHDTARAGAEPAAGNTQPTPDAGADDPG